MKKGFALIELIVVIVIMGILAAAAVPKFFRLVCASNGEQCRVESPEIYTDMCYSHPTKCKLDVLDSLCTVNMDKCMRHDARAWSLVTNYRLEMKMKKAEKKAAEQPKPIEQQKPVQPVQQTVSNVDTEKLKQELLAEYEKKLDSITKVASPKPVEEVQTSIQGSKEEFIKCIKKCTRENTAESLVDFCIKDKCK